MHLIHRIPGKLRELVHPNIETTMSFTTSNEIMVDFYLKQAIFNTIIVAMERSTEDIWLGTVNEIETPYLIERSYAWKK